MTDEDVNNVDKTLLITINMHIQISLVKFVYAYIMAVRVFTSEHGDSHFALLSIQQHFAILLKKHSELGCASSANCQRTVFFAVTVLV